MRIYIQTWPCGRGEDLHKKNATRVCVCVLYGRCMGSVNVPRCVRAAGVSESGRPFSCERGTCHTRVEHVWARVTVHVPVVTTCPAGSLQPCAVHVLHRCVGVVGHVPHTRVTVHVPVVTTCPAGSLQPCAVHVLHRCVGVAGHVTHTRAPQHPGNNIPDNNLVNLPTS